VDSYVYPALIYRTLAAEAEANMEAVTPPLFLRFVNLLMNDAVFLLDEALSNMAQLRQMQTAREAGEWQQLTVHEREQNEGYMQHIGMITRCGSSCICTCVAHIL
jgi:ubiquitin conjugation factor E4 A